MRPGARIPTLMVALAAWGSLQPIAEAAPETADPVRLSIQTVPPTPGVDFRLFLPCTLYLPPGETASDFCFADDRPPPSSWTFTSDGRGSAAIEVDPGLYHLEVVGQRDLSGDDRADFSRWEDDVFAEERLLDLSQDLWLVAGFDVSRSLRLTFADPQGAPVSAARVASVELRSSTGSVHSLEGPGPHVLPATRVLGRDAGLESVALVYSVQRAIVDGSNVVNRGQQRFAFDADGAQWQIDLLLFSARFLGRDAFFGAPVGDGILLEYPDGSQRRVAYDATGAAHLDGLARGGYRARVTGAAGVALPTIVILSRDQSARPIVLTYLDIAVALLGGLLLAVGLLAVGRPHLLRRRRPTG